MVNRLVKINFNVKQTKESLSHGGDRIVQEYLLRKYWEIEN